MSKTSLCFKLLKLLYARNQSIGIKEIASILETNERNIPEYIKELRDMGYDIETEHGRYGGYKLNRSSTLPMVNFTDEEKKSLMEGYEYLSSRNDFPNIKEYEKAIAKIKAATMPRTVAINNVVIANRFPLSISKENLENRYNTISNCIEHRNVIEMEYLDLKNNLTRRIVHPYKLYMYNNAWYMLAYDELKNSILYFKINRIKSLMGTFKKFRVLSSYNESDYIDEYGMKQNGEWYPIKLKVTGVYRVLLTERIFGKNQRIEEFDDYSILSCEMQNKWNVISFVLGLGEFCNVLEPSWLKEEVKNSCKKIIKKY